jgi:hypothetical protein
MRTVEFRHLLDDNDALRVRFEMDRGRVIRFTVQLECRFDDEWTPVVRYDTSHGFAHCDRFHPHQGPTKTELAVQDFNEALNVAFRDLTCNWTEYRRRYGQWLR